MSEQNSSKKNVTPADVAPKIPGGSELNKLLEKNEATIVNNTSNISVLKDISTEPIVLLFDSSSAKYISGIDQYNVAYVQEASNALNVTLQQRGHLFVNEVIDYLGLTRIREGQILGWVSPDSINLVIEPNPLDNAIYITLNHKGDILDRI